MTRIAALAALGLAATPAAAQVTAALSYICDRGVQIPAVYVAGAEADVVVIYVEGRLINLQSAPSASGARYAFPNDGSGYVWWEHQGKASLAWFDAAAGTETVLYADCVPAG